LGVCFRKGSVKARQKSSNKPTESKHNPACSPPKKSAKCVLKCLPKKRQNEPKRAKKSQKEPKSAKKRQKAPKSEKTQKRAKMCVNKPIKKARQKAYQKACQKPTKTWLKTHQKARQNVIDPFCKKLHL
jgi:hypothetical protein